MGNTIYKNIKEYKNGNKEIFREIINVFNPLINKLSKSVNGEDTRQDLLVHLLEIINKLPEENKFEDDRIIFAYISKALKYEYIKLSKKNDKIKNSEVELNLEIELEYEEFDSEVEVLNLFEVLTEKEEYIMKLIYINYLSKISVIKISHKYFFNYSFSVTIRTCLNFPTKKYYLVIFTFSSVLFPVFTHQIAPLYHPHKNKIRNKILNCI